MLHWELKQDYVEKKTKTKQITNWIVKVEALKLLNGNKN